MQQAKVKSQSVQKIVYKDGRTADGGNFIRPTSRVKRHPDPFNHFATVHPPDRPTDRQTDRPTDRQTDTWNWRQVCTKSRLYLMVSDTANKQ